MRRKCPSYININNNLDGCVCITFDEYLYLLSVRFFFVMHVFKYKIIFNESLNNSYEKKS